MSICFTTNLMFKSILLFRTLKINLNNFFLKRKEIPTVYLTFDDGILNGTSNCVDTCIRNNVKATFFIVGSHVNGTKKRDILNKLKAEKSLLLVANHSHSHANEKYILFYHDVQGALEDFIYSQKILELTNNIVRLPGNGAWGNKNGSKASPLVKPLVNLLLENKFNVIGWDWEFKIPNQPVGNPKELANTLTKSFLSIIKSNKSYTNNHYVILLHDWMFQHSNKVQVLSLFIQDLKTKNILKFGTIDNYPNLF